MENKKYSMLIVALYCYTGHIAAFVRNLRQKNSMVEITILTEKPDEVKNAISDSKVNIVWYNVSSVDYIKLRWLKFLFIKYKQCRFFAHFYKNKRYDIINVHFANRYMSYVYKYLRAMSDNIVITPWGSDVLRIPEKNLKQLSFIYKKADYITTSPNMPLGKKILQEFKVDPQKKRRLSAKTTESTKIYDRI